MPPGVFPILLCQRTWGVSNDRKVFVVRKDPNLTEADLIKHCRENLTNYKVPKLVEFRDELPKTNVGKILRRELR